MAVAAALLGGGEGDKRDRRVGGRLVVEATHIGVAGTERRKGGALANSGGSDVVRVEAPVSLDNKKLSTRCAWSRGTS